MTVESQIAEVERRRAELTADFERAETEHDQITEQYGADRGTWPAGQVTRADNLGRRMKKLADDLGECEQRIDGYRRIGDVIARNDPRAFEPGDGRTPDLIVRTHSNPWDGLDDRMNGDTPTGLRSRALDALAVVPDAPQAARSTGGELVEHDPTGAAARWVLAAGDPAYARAFAHIVRDPVRGHMFWTEAERAAFTRAEYYSRGMVEGTDGSGGYLVPFMLDPTIMLTNAGVTGSLRSLARVVQTASSAWHGITSAGVTAEWKVEAVEASDASPTVAQPEIPVHMGSAYVKFSMELDDDSSLMSQLGTLFSDSKTNLEEAAFVTGSGSGQPKGLITAVAADSGSIVTPGTAETFAAADVYSVQNALPARHQAAAQWAANLAVINDCAQFETTNGALMFPQVGSVPSVLLRKPLSELSSMDGAFDKTATANNYLLVYGDFSNYVIADRVGSQVQMVPVVVGDNGRPTGERGAYFRWRTGADCTNTDAFRLLNIATTA